GIVLCSLLWLSPEASAQTVVEVQGGGSSLNGGYGATANFWRTGMDGWIGVGYLDGLRAGAFLRKSVGKDTLGFGNDALIVRLPTDVFTPGFNMLVQGISYTGGSDRSSYLVFGGASSAGLGAPSFQATSIEEPIGAVFLQHRAAPTVRLTATTLLADRQTVLPGVQWQPLPDLTAGLVAGVGSGRPYAASSVLLRRGGFGLKASYAWNPNRFRRAPVATPNQTEVDRENFTLTYDLSPRFSLGVGRQNYVQDSADSRLPVRATGNTAFAGGVWADTRLTAGIYDSRSQGISNLSSYLAVGREVAAWLDAELFLLQSRPEGLPVTTTPLANLRWRISSRLGLSQQISFHAGRPAVLFGATLMTPIGDFGADYQVVHQPFKPFNPFRSALNLTARLQLGKYSTSVGTFVQPDGSVDYSASGSTFLYMGSFGGMQPQQLGGRMARYVVRGTVRDEDGNPVEGAAVGIDSDVVFTNSAGQFFHRLGRPGRSMVSILTKEFLLPGQWEVVSAPAEALASSEDGPGIDIILRHPTAISAP
ncbi:MAG TPA: hypothetical protein VJ808_00215, partial [Gemmatimonadales bacterium]|nr:hypothetical protein [Gemmatimonadales bacterium]